MAQNSNMNSRIKEFDSIRALCMIYVVGITHMTQYSTLEYDSFYIHNFGLGVLATFIFISGLFCGRKMQDIKDVGAFYKKRFVRIYPLFFIACVCFLITYYLFHFHYIDGIKQFVLTVSGLAVFTESSPKTIWFVCLLLMLYLFTPLVIIWKNKKVRAFVAVVLFAVVFVLDYCLVIDYRVSLLVPFYLFGLLCFEYKPQVIKTLSKTLIGLIGLAIYILASYLNNIYDMKNLVYVYMLAFLIVISCVGSWISRINAINKVMSFISYGSMASYLFHRFYFGVIYKVTGVIVWPIAIFVLFPVWLVISYYIQLVYDKIIDLIMPNKSKQIESKK